MQKDCATCTYAMSETFLYSCTSSNPNGFPGGNGDENHSSHLSCDSKETFKTVPMFVNDGTRAEQRFLNGGFSWHECWIICGWVESEDKSGIMKTSPGIYSQVQAVL